MPHSSRIWDVWESTDNQPFLGELGLCKQNVCIYFAWNGTCTFDHLILHFHYYGVFIDDFSVLDQEWLAPKNYISKYGNQQNQTLWCHIELLDGFSFIIRNISFLNYKYCVIDTPFQPFSTINGTILTFGPQVSKSCSDNKKYEDYVYVNGTRNKRPQNSAP